MLLRWIIGTCSEAARRERLVLCFFGFCMCQLAASFALLSLYSLKCDGRGAGHGVACVCSFADYNLGLKDARSTRMSNKSNSAALFGIAARSMLLRGHISAHHRLLMLYNARLLRCDRIYILPELEHYRRRTWVFHRSCRARVCRGDNRLENRTALRFVKKI